MAWETINYKCGHTEKVQLYGPHKDREHRKWYLENYCDCPDCVEKAHAAEVARKAAASELTGTDKQKAWAEDIRSKFRKDVLGKIQEQLDRVPAWLQSKGRTMADLTEEEQKVYEELQQLISIGERFLDSQSYASAEFWIRHRCAFESRYSFMRFVNLYFRKKIVTISEKK